MYIYHALINALGAHIIRINLNTIPYAHIEDSPTKTIYIRHFVICFPLLTRFFTWTSPEWVTY